MTGCALARAAARILFALQERATAGYWFVSALYALPGNADMEEPVFLGDADGGRRRRGLQETLQPVAAGRRAWLVGAGQVWTSAQTDAAVDIAERTYTPTKYEYAVSTSGGGVLQLQIERSVGCSAGAALESFGSGLSAGNLRRRHALARSHAGSWGQWPAP